MNNFVAEVVSRGYFCFDTDEKLILKNCELKKEYRNHDCRYLKFLLYFLFLVCKNAN